jgi:hypothetical protein
MFENIDLKIADATKQSTNIIVFSQRVTCTRTGCYGTTCKYPC